MGLTVAGISQERAVPQTALDFLTIPMDARSAGIGDIGVGTTPDAYSHQYNPAKYLFGDNMNAGVSLAYSPWLRNLVKDMNLASVGGYYVIDEMQSVSASFRYFSMGDMDFYGSDLSYTGSNSPYQLAVDVAYARKLSQYFGVSVALRYALADLFPKDAGYKKGWGISGDLFIYFNKNLELGTLPSRITAGLSLTDIGSKVSFHENDSSYFMPMSIKLGAGLTTNFTEDHKLMIAGELLRSLVPTSRDKRDDSGFGGMISSIEEGSFRSIVWSLGTEYGFKDMLFGRMGYHHESERWGNRQYLTFGAGIRYKIVQFDIAYLVSTGMKHNSMSNTIRLSLAVDIL